MKDFMICDPCVVWPWLDDLTFKQQTVLLSALRGCDNVSKEDVSKKFVRAFRSVVLQNASPNEGRFMEDSITKEDIQIFTSSLDQYPMHWLFHFLHAIEIVGYKHPEIDVREQWMFLYFIIVHDLHLSPETEEEMDLRLKDGFSRDCWKT